MMEIDAEMRRRGWYDGGDGLAMRVIVAGDVFAITVRTWHDEGEASHLS